MTTLLNTSKKIVKTVTTLAGEEVKKIKPSSIIDLATTLFTQAEEGKQVAIKTSSKSVAEEVEKVETLAKKVVKIYDDLDLEKHSGTSTLYNVDVENLINTNTYVYGVNVENLSKDVIFNQMMDVQKQLESKKGLSEKLNGISEAINKEVEELNKSLKKLVNLYDTWNDEDLNTTLETLTNI